MSETCKMMVPTQPKVGDVNRHPDEHRCRRPIYADGYCCTHSAAYQETVRAGKKGTNEKMTEATSLQSQSLGMSEMTLRDFFAVEAMKAIIAATSSFETYDLRSEFAYAQADSMLKARKHNEESVEGLSGIAAKT